MLEFRIKETGQVEKMYGVVDPKTGQNWTGDLIGNAGAFNDGQFDWNEEAEMYECSQETFDWWENLCERYQQADAAKHEFLQGIEDYEDRAEADESIQTACSCDLENMPGAIMAAIRGRRWRWATPTMCSLNCHCPMVSILPSQMGISARARPLPLTLLCPLTPSLTP